MERWRMDTRLPAILDALSLSEDHPAVRRLADAFGGEPAEVRERPVGEPALRSRRLLFASGGEIILHDDAVAAVLLHLAPRGLDLADWIAGAGGDATLADLADALGAAPRFAGLRTPYFSVGGGYVRADFKDGRGWKDAGNLLGLAVTVERPGLACRPDDDDCAACGDLLVRGSGGVDVDGTADALATALAAGLLTEDAHRVRLADLRPLHASGLMERAESQLTCAACGRIVCFTLFRDVAPTFGYHVLNDATRRPRETIPPVERWGDAARIAQAHQGMRYVDHEPGAWFLVEQQGVLYLDARYSYSAVIDDAALIRLDESELADYRTGGHDYLSGLASRIHDSAPYTETSPYHERDLYRRPDGRAYRDAVTGAIIEHTWSAKR
ncbi:MAG TPA: hypothetical protein VFU12_18555 [Glycomyces sp.]|nr:hypothetical protein [Glycomyces sp.]